MAARASSSWPSRRHASERTDCAWARIRTSPAARAQAYAEAAKNVDHAVRGALWIGLCDAATGADGAAATLRAALAYAERERTKLRAPTARLVAQARGALTPE